MFSKSNGELNLSGLDDFIEKPSQECKEEELGQGVAKVIFVLSKNPEALMDIIASHPYIPATFLLDDLAEKMSKRNCLEKLGMLFDKCPDKLVDSCIYNSHDLERCIKAMPAQSSKIMEHITSNEGYMKRILESDIKPDGSSNPEGTIKEIDEKYPNYRNQFAECYSKHFKITPTPK